MQVRRIGESCAWCSVGFGRWCWWQRMPRISRGSPRGSPSSGGGSSDRGSDQSFAHSTVMRTSSSSHGSAHSGRGLRVKINLPIFKDKKMKYAVIYCSWWWDMAFFCQSGCNDQHLLLYIFCLLQGFPGDLAWSLGMDASLSDILQMLDEHYGVVLTFNAFSKELYSFKQGLGEKVAEFGVHRSQQVQKLQSEYPGRIWPKCGGDEAWPLLWGLKPKYQCMLAHKVDGENPAGYSNLLLATQKLERRAGARDPLSPKTAVTSWSNVICSKTPGNLFPSWKLKGNHTFITQAATVGNAKGKADSGVKQEGEGETKPLADKEVKVLGGAEGTDQPMENSIHFAKVVKLYQ